MILARDLPVIDDAAVAWEMEAVIIGRAQPYHYRCTVVKGAGVVQQQFIDSVRAALGGDYRGPFETGINEDAPICRRYQSGRSGVERAAFKIEMAREKIIERV